MPHFRNLRSLGLALAAGALCALAPLSSAPAQDADGWHVEQLSGTARLRGADGAWHPLERGSAIPAGAAVETGANSKLVLMHHKDVVTTSPLSAFEIPTQDPATGPSFLQRLGTLMFRIEHSPGRRFEVDAPHLAAVVKGTVFTVSANDTADSVHVAEGAVEVTAALSHKVALLRPGQSAVVSSGGRDLSVLDGSAAKPQHRSDNDIPGSDAKGTSTAEAAPGLTRTVGEQHVDISGVTQGLVGGAGRRTDAGLFEDHAAQHANGAPQPGRANLTGGANPNGAGGNALLHSADAAGGNPNAGGGNANAGGGNPNAHGGNPNAGGGNPNAGGGNPNAGGGNPNAGGGNPNAGGGNGHGKP